MLIYPKNKKSDQKDDPVWKEDSFLRLRGLADALVHKTDFKTEDGKNVLAGAYYERVRRELEALEAAKLAQLSKSLGPKAAALKAIPQPTGGSSNSSSPRSTGARRAAREAGERRARAASERKELAAVHPRQSCWMPRHEINEVYCRANASLVKYSKAGKFRVISDEEIPRFHPDFSARKVRCRPWSIDKQVLGMKNPFKKADSAKSACAGPRAHRDRLRPPHHHPPHAVRIPGMHFSGPCELPRL